MLVLVSDVCDVVYVSWWVDVCYVLLLLLGYYFVVYVGCMLYIFFSYCYGYFGLVLVGLLCVLMLLL